MRVNKKNLFVLFSLTQFLRKMNRKFEDQPLQTSVSKIGFIKLMQDSGIFEKTERGLYKNLEILETKKLISYENKFLKLTAKGLEASKKIEAELLPYLQIKSSIESVEPLDMQTYFK